jgi:lipoprotein signal peptidase
VRGGRQRTSNRIRLGSVRDFLATPWAIVNLADLAVAAGLIGLVIALAAREPKLRTRLTPTAR